MGAFGSRTMPSWRWCCFSYCAFSQSCCSCSFLTCTTHGGTCERAEPVQTCCRPQPVLLLLDLHIHVERTRGRAKQLRLKGPSQTALLPVKQPTPAAEDIALAALERQGSHWPAMLAMQQSNAPHTHPTHGIPVLTRASHSREHSVVEVFMGHAHP